MREHPWQVWLARLLIGIVTIWNLLAAFQFLISPASFAPGFELEGAAGNAMVQGMGLLFVMWNVPYLFAMVNPIRNRRSLTEAGIMQIIGATGETLLLINLPGDHSILVGSVSRFIVFDSIGVLLLIIAWGIVRKKTPDQS